MKKVFHLFAVAMCGVLMLTVVSCQEKNNPEEENGNISSQVQAVDLGLPSGIKWANMNVGATTPEGYGDYFAWGETKPKENYSSETYTCPFAYTTLPANYDAAYVNWGENWRMPTETEQDELRNTDNCTWTWTDSYKDTGVAGYIVSSKKNNNSIFLPASGFRRGSQRLDAGSYGNYWSSSHFSDNVSHYLGFGSKYVGGFGSQRYEGQSVRPVCQ